MLSNEIKQNISHAYKQWLESKKFVGRQSQRHMIAEIARTFGAIEQDAEGLRQSNNGVSVIEAGTGTGKTVAYLIAALPIAQIHNKTIVVSTATVALQEQLINRDLPELLKYSGLEFSYALAKGRRRYLCLDRLASVLSGTGQQTALLYPDEIAMGVDPAAEKTYKKMLHEWDAGNWDGDKDSWPEVLTNEQWFPVTSDSSGCTGRKCSFYNECSFYKARDELSSADCIVANHDLVLSDLKMGGGQILPKPEDTIYIFDEAHHLADKAIAHFTHRLRLDGFKRTLGQWLSFRELLLKQVESPKILQQQMSDTQELVDGVVEHINVLKLMVVDFFQRQQGESAYYRFSNGTVPESLLSIAEELHQLTLRLNAQVEYLNGWFEKALEGDFGDVDKQIAEEQYPVLGAYVARMAGALKLWESYSKTKDDAVIARWIAAVIDDDFEFVSAPVLAADLLIDNLWERCYGALLTSATLSVADKFDSFHRQMGLKEQATYMILSSPFNYAEVATLHIPKEGFDGSKPWEHTDAIVDVLPSLIKNGQGTLVLFASRRQMDEVADKVADQIQVRLLVQGDMAIRELLQQHRQAVDEGYGSVIFGLASFAEGIDLPGDYCSHVIIAKVPFPVPDEPLDAAMGEWIEQQGGNAFKEVSLPVAAIRLKQSVGRLLRSEHDSGTVTLLDSRMLGKWYGKMLIKSLPPLRLADSLPNDTNELAT